VNRALAVSTLRASIRSAAKVGATTAAASIQFGSRQTTCGTSLSADQKRKAILAGSFARIASSGAQKRLASTGPRGNWSQNDNEKTSIGRIIMPQATEDEMVALAERCEARGLQSVREWERRRADINYGSGGTAFREAAFQWLSIAAAIRARAWQLYT
jgi:hypothetical protein